METKSVDLLAAQYQIAIQRKANDAIAEAGKQAVALIESAGPPPEQALPPHVGTKLNIRA